MGVRDDRPKFVQSVVEVMHATSFTSVDTQPDRLSMPALLLIRRVARIVAQNGGIAVVVITKRF